MYIKINTQTCVEGQKRAIEKIKIGGRWQKERGNLETKKIRELLKNENKKIRKDGCDWRIRQRSFKLPVWKRKKSCWLLKKEVSDLHVKKFRSVTQPWFQDRHSPKYDYFWLFVHLHVVWWGEDVEWKGAALLEKEGGYRPKKQERSMHRH